MKPGDQVKLLKAPALVDGVFTPIGRMVEITAIDEATQTITVKFLDREDFPHLIPNLKKEQLTEPAL